MRDGHRWNGFYHGLWLQVFCASNDRNPGNTWRHSDKNVHHRCGGRIVDTNEPERGETKCSYAYNGTGLVVTRTRPSANQTSTGVTHTTTQYDAVGRVVSSTYDDGLTPAKNYYYDANISQQQWSVNPTYPVGVLVGTTSGSGNSLTRMITNHDIMGNVTAMWECAPSICGTTSQAGRTPLQFSYDLAGHLTSSSDAASGNIVYGYSPAGEVTSITNQTYTDAGNAPNLVSNVVNTPFGPASYTLGNGLFAAKTYDSLGRLNGSWLCSGSSQPSCQGGTQIYGNTVGTVGTRVNGLCDTVLNQCESHGYDEFSRLTSVSGSRSFSYIYDRFGNRTQQTASPSGPQPAYSFNIANNQINNTSGVQIDAAGNVTSDGFHSYTYDAEGNVLNVDGGSTATYVYDALNRRVSTQTASSSLEYMYDFAGRRTSTWIPSLNVGNGARIYWGNLQIAFRAQDGGTYFDQQDYLGTERVRTNSAGSLAATDYTLAFGDGYTESTLIGSASQAPPQFAGLDYDSESNTNHTGFRQYSPTQGRWMSPDPYTGNYDLTNPQSFNRYRYVLNNPFGLIDPSGQDPCDGNQDPDVRGGARAQITCADPPAPCVSAGNPSCNDPGCAVQSCAVENSPTIILPTAPPAPNNRILPCFVRGVAAGVVTAAVVGVVAAVAAPIVGTAAVTAGLGALAITGAVALGVTSGIDISNHNWAGLAYNAGNVLGGALTGFAGGARVATAIEPNATPGWSPSSWQAQAYDSSKGSLWQWLGTGPTHASAGLATTGGSFLGSLFGGC